MRRRIGTLLFVGFVFFAHPAAGDDRTPAQIQAAKQFAFEGMSLTTSLSAFLEKYPAAELREAQSSAKAGVACYRVKALQTADAAEYLFFNDALYEVTVFYSPARLQEMGGEDIPLKKLVQKLGPQDRKSPGHVRAQGEETFTARWDLPDTARRIVFVASRKSTYVSFSDPAQARLADKRLTEQAELGF